MKIKEIEVGSGKPVICVPIVGITKDAIVQEAREIVCNHTEMMEWRVDWFTGIENLDEVEAVLQELAPIMTQTILLFTYRSKEQGGNGTLPIEEVMELDRLAAKSGCVDLIDVEFYSFEETADLMKELQQLGARIITSHHDFERTPDVARMSEILEDMNRSSADIVKLAVMPQSRMDVIDLMKMTTDFHMQNPHRPIVTMSMGQLGIMSRLSGELTGSCITFGAHGQCSAPGQMEQGILQGILDAVHGGL